MAFEAITSETCVVFNESKAGGLDVDTRGSKKPLGIVIITIFTAFSGLLSLLFGTLTIFMASLSVWLGPLAFALILLGVVCFAVTYGLWTFEPWAHTAAVVLYVVFALLGLVSMLFDRTAGNIVLQLIGIAIYALALNYLAKPETKATFGPH